MWQKVKGCLPSLLWITFFFAVGIFLGVKVANIWFPLDPKPYWRLLESSHKFKHIMQVNSHMVWAQTEDGKMYYREVYCDDQLNCEQWSEATSIPIYEDYGEVGERPMKKGSYCQFDNLRKPETLSGNIVECTAGWYVGMENGATAYYALLDDGSIWVWAEDNSTIENMFRVLHYLCVISVSSVFYIAALVFFAIFRRTRNLSLNNNG